MPFFSILIPAYNVSQYLGSCLGSVIKQDFSDWEVIVVDDGSTDATPSILKEIARSADRITAIFHERNEGAHRSRMDAVMACHGSYSIFLDADDELSANALSLLHDELVRHPVQMLHFGISVVGVTVDNDERSVFERDINRETPRFVGEDVVNASFSEECGYAVDWRVTQRVYETSLLKSAYSSMTTDRLGRAEDCYEYFVIASKCDGEAIARNDIKAYVYYYGRGVSGGSVLGVEDFLSSARGFQLALEAIADYASCFDSFDLSGACAGAKKKQLQLLMNDWRTRVSDNEKVAAALAVSPIIGEVETATELMRLCRDEAYHLLMSDFSYERVNCIKEWFNIAVQLINSGTRETVEFSYYKAAATSHLSDLDKRCRLERGKKSDIRIFVSTHKDVDLFDSEILQPVQVGSAQSPIRFPWALHDDAGINISRLNPMYCELTTQYWAWKNVNAEYYGFCHYRRYFDFNERRHEENAWGEIIADRIDKDSQTEFALHDDEIRASVEGYDVITTEFKDLRAFPGNYRTPLEQYDAAPLLYSDDLKCVVRILLELYPDWERDVQSFLNGHRSCFCNMFIMKKEIFNQYCDWLFPILERFVSETDFSKYSKEALRTPGHLSERLFNIFYNHHIRLNAGWKTKQVQCVHFEHPEARSLLSPAFESCAGYKSIVPVAFAADNAYVPMLTTTIYSMLKNASSQYLYDIVILERAISQDNKDILRAFFSQFENVSIRFFDAASIIDRYKLTTSNSHISVETYYRFLVQELLPFYKKVLYLDSDLIIQGDVAELFEFDLKGCVLAAAHDLDFLGNLNSQDGNRFKYAKKKLGMSNPYAYFQAGVLVLNIPELRRLHSTGEWLEIASDPNYIYNDQDVLNAECEGRVLYLDYAWNVMIDCAGRIAKIFSKAPACHYEAFLCSRSHEKIVHYAGFEKPWTTVGCDRGELYWQYARDTPFYERLLAQLMDAEVGSTEDMRPRVISETSGVRRYVDPLLPIGSRRREMAKSIARVLRRR